MDFLTFRRFACFPVVATSDPTWTLTLTATGTGAGVATMMVNLSASSSATLDGAGYFYTDAAGTLGETQSKALASGWNTLYIKVTSGSANLVFAQRSLVTMWGSPSSPTNAGWTTPTNSPSATLTFASLPLTLTRLNVNGMLYLTGSIPSECHSFQSLGLSGSSNAAALSGTLVVPSSITFLSWGAGSSGSVSIDISNGSSLTGVAGGGGVSFVGSINALSSCSFLAINTGQPFNCSGDLSSLRNSTDVYVTTGTSTLTYTPGTVWGASRSRLYLRSQSFTTTQADSILIDMAASITTATGSKVINLKGSKTTASDAAYAYLTGLGFAVSVTA